MTDIDLSAPEVQDAIKKASDTAVKEATEGLIAKRDELLSEVKQLKKGRQVDPADLERVEHERDELKASLAEANKAAKKAGIEAEAARKALEAAEGYTASLLVDNGLSAELAKAGVTNPVHQKAAKAMLAGQVSIEADGDAKVPKLGGKALADAIKEWADSDEGKHFVTAPDTSGGGSQGGRGTTTQPEGNFGGDKAARLKAAEALLKQNSE